MKRLVLPTTLGLAVLLLSSTAALNGAAQTPRGGTAAAPAAGALSAATRQQLMASLAKGAAYEKQQQPADGVWERASGTGFGVSGVVATALLREPGTTKAQQMAIVGKTIDQLAKLAKPDGGIYDGPMIPHYMTAVSVMALVAAGRPADKPIILKARQYLVDHLLDEGEGVPPSDKFYGGMGYGGTSDGGKADIISLEYGLQAMKDADLPANSDAWAKALKFLQRTQNNSETNDQAWAKNDGGFIYYPGYSQIEGTTESYGAATYAGMLSYTWANLKKTDPRVQATYKWLKNNYTVDTNPGLGDRVVYYYYMVMAKALQAYGEPIIVDAKGKSHNWREELGRKLVSLQHPEGYWVNTNNAEMQDNKVLVTAFTMMALEAILQ